MPWPGAGTAAGHSHVLRCRPSGWYSAPEAMGPGPACARMGSLHKSVDGLPGRAMWSAGSASCSLRVGGRGGGRAAG